MVRAQRRLMTLSTSAVAACCSSASSRSRVSRATSAFWPAGAEPRRGMAFGALRALGFNAERRRTLAGLPPALGDFFTVSAPCAENETF